MEDEGWNERLQRWDMRETLIVGDRIAKAMEEGRKERWSMDEVEMETPQNDVWMKVSSIDWRRFNQEEIEEEEEEELCPFCAKKLSLFPQSQAHIVLCSGMLDD